jgi:outer membrane protein TolC
MRRYALAILLSVLSGAAAAASDTEPPLLTLRDAVEIALEHNHRLGIADDTLDAAEANARRARSGRLPRFDLIENFSWTTNPALVFTNKLGQEAFTPDDFDPDRLNNPDDLTNFNTILSASYPLYAGGRIDGGLDVARLSLDAAEAGRERTRQEVVHEVLDAFSGAVLADANLRVAEDARETALANVVLVSDLHAAGLVVESDLLQAKVRESEVEEMVVRTASAREIARAALNLTLGRDLGTPFSLPRQVTTEETSVDALDALIDEALLNRPDLTAAEARARASEHAVRLARSGRRPEVGLEGRYEANAEEFIGADGTNWSVLVGVRIPLFEGNDARAAVAGAEAGARAARGRTELLRRSVELETRSAYHNVDAARKSLEQSRGAVDLARESLRMVRDRYREGLTTLVELLDAETALTRARTREVAALRALLLSRAGLDLAVGRL